MTQEALKLAIQLRDTASGYWTENEIPIIEKLIELLAQPEQEPVADDFFRMIADRNPKPFSTPQRTWVGLTAGEILDILISVDEKTVRLPSMLGQFACAIEAKLKEKNT